MVKSEGFFPWPQGFMSLIWFLSAVLIDLHLQVRPRGAALCRSSAACCGWAWSGTGAQPASKQVLCVQTQKERAHCTCVCHEPSQQMLRLALEQDKMSRLVGTPLLFPPAALSLLFVTLFSQGNFFSLPLLWWSHNIIREWLCLEQSTQKQTQRFKGVLALLSHSSSVQISGGWAQRVFSDSWVKPGGDIPSPGRFSCWRGVLPTGAAPKNPGPCRGTAVRADRLLEIHVHLWAMK